MDDADAFGTTAGADDVDASDGTPDDADVSGATTNDADASNSNR